jgi:hypothetical protein
MLKTGILLLAVMFSSACTTTVAQKNIQICRLFCNSRNGLYQIIVDRFKGVGCHCKNGDVLWVEIDDKGTFEDRRPIDEFEDDL